MHSAAESFTSNGNLRNYAEPKPESNRHMLDFVHLVFTVQDHILSTAGDVLNSTLCPDLKILVRDRVEFSFCLKQVQYIP